MVVEFKKEHIKDIASAHLLSWKVAFKGILSQNVLSNLKSENFEKNWKIILTQKERANYIWLNQDGIGLGFISFGKPKDKNEEADFEIYGIYVHPSYWGKKIGFHLMEFGIESIRKINPFSKIILWTMEENKLSCNFYNRYGFIENGKYRMAERNNEPFKEIQFELK